MNAEIPNGKYVLAVSGGVDSMVLLDLLVKNPGVELIVAHFNHNIRDKSIEDEMLVRQTAEEYGVPFEASAVNLGKGASEEAARSARYKFLNNMKKKHNAKKIITAHHQDDMIETAMINLIRGTNRRGLSSIINNKDILRPMLGVPKSQIEKYARANSLNWSEDETNSDTSYLRNYLRIKILIRLTAEQRCNLISNIEKVANTNTQVDHELAIISQYIGKDLINRQAFSDLPSSVSSELIAYHLTHLKALNYDSKTVSRLNQAIRTSPPGSVQPVKQKITLELASDTAKFITP